MVVCFVNWLLVLVYVFCMMALFKEFLSNLRETLAKQLHLWQESPIFSNYKSRLCPLSSPLDGSTQFAV